MTPKIEQADFVKNTLAKMVELLGLQIDITEAAQEDVFALNLKTEDTGRLIGRKGHYLQSLELLLNRILRKRYDQAPWVELDVDGYQGKRRSRRCPQQDAERLEKLAADAAKEVKRWGQPKKIGPFNARERRVVHLALRDDKDIETESEEKPDRNGLKKVAIRLEDKPAG